MTDRRRQVALDRAQVQREHWARELAEQDAELLDMRAEGKTYRTIALVLGISHAAAHERVQAAQRREKTRQELAAG